MVPSAASSHWTHPHKQNILAAPRVHEFVGAVCIVIAAFHLSKRIRYDQLRD